MVENKQEVREIRCPDCNLKHEDVFAYGWGHDTVYSIKCRCGKIFSIGKKVYADDYFGLMYEDKYTIHETVKDDKRLEMINDEFFLMQILNRDHPEYKSIEAVRESYIKIKR